MIYVVLAFIILALAIGVGKMKELYRRTEGQHQSLVLIVDQLKDLLTDSTRLRAKVRTLDNLILHLDNDLVKFKETMAEIETELREELRELEEATGQVAGGLNTLTEGLLSE